MSVIKKMRKQKAVWWPRLSPDTYGTFSFGAPVEISCRWDDSGKEYRTVGGEMLVSDSTVYPDRVLRVGDRLKKGALDVSTPADPTQTTGAYEVRRFDETPNFKATEFLYTAYMGSSIL